MEKNTISNSQPLQLFLHRNLSYVRFRKWRTKKGRRRSGSKMGSVLLTADKLVERKRGAKHYMAFTFSGFYCNEVTADIKFAEMELIHKETNTNVSGHRGRLMDSHPNLIIVVFFF